MKPMSAYVLGLLLLASAVAWGQPLPEVPPAAQGFCQANNGVLVIFVDNQGQRRGFVCPKVGNKPVTQPGKRPSGVNINVRTTNLGEVTKYKAENDPDPCLEYTVGGQLKVVCW